MGEMPACRWMFKLEWRWAQKHKDACGL